MLLKFSPANAKLTKLEKKTGKRVYSLSLSSGITCPFASKCLSTAIQLPNGKFTVKDGENTEFRCYSASQEALYPTLFRLTRHNHATMELARSKGGASEVAKLIINSLPKNAGIIRINESGDLYNPAILTAWVIVARLRPHIQFYGYTKSIPYLKQQIHTFPKNLKFTASYGGKCDDLIKVYNLPNVVVVNSTYEARKLKRVIDHDDSHAYMGAKQYALLVHNTQPKGSKAAIAWQRIKKTSGGYSKQSNKKAGV
jgi:Gene product 88